MGSIVALLKLFFVTIDLGGSRCVDRFSVVGLFDMNGKFRNVVLKQCHYL